MFNVFVYIFSVFTTKIFYCVISYVLDEGVCVRRASREKIVLRVGIYSGGLGLLVNDRVGVV